MADDQIRKETTGYIPSHPDAVRWIHDVEKEIQWDLMARLRGGYVVKNNKTDEYDIAYAKNFTPKPILNEKGIHGVMMLASTFLSRIHGLTDYSEDRILILCRETSSAVTRMLAVNMQEYGLTPSSLRVIKVMIMDHFESIISRSKDGLGINLASGMTKVTEVTQGEKEQKKRLGHI